MSDSQGHVSEHSPRGSVLSQPDGRQPVSRRYCSDFIIFTCSIANIKTHFLPCPGAQITFYHWGGELYVGELTLTGILVTTNTGQHVLHMYNG